MPVTMGLLKRTIVYFTTALTTVGQTTYTVPAGVFSLTVKAWGAGGGGAGSADGDGGCGGPGGFAQARCISLREAARLQSFPDAFRFCGSMNTQLTQIGNAVPPLLAFAVASQLRTQLLKSVQRRKPQSLQAAE